MKQKFLKSISLLSLWVAAGAISGASRMGAYQGQETKELQSKKLF